MRNKNCMGGNFLCKNVHCKILHIAFLKSNIVDGQRPWKKGT